MHRGEGGGRAGDNLILTDIDRLPRGCGPESSKPSASLAREPYLHSVEARALCGVTVRCGVPLELQSRSERKRAKGMVCEPGVGTQGAGEIEACLVVQLYKTEWM